MKTIILNGIHSPFPDEVLELFRLPEQAEALRALCAGEAGNAVMIVREFRSLEDEIAPDDFESHRVLGAHLGDILGLEGVVPVYSSCGAAHGANASLAVPTLLHGISPADIKNDLPSLQAAVGLRLVRVIPDLLGALDRARGDLAVQICGRPDPRFDIPLAGPGAPLFHVADSETGTLHHGPCLPAVEDALAEEAPRPPDAVEVLRSEVLLHYGSADLADLICRAYAEKRPEILENNGGALC